MHSVVKVMPDTATQEEVIAVVHELNADPAIDGILVQLPVPKHIDSKAVIDAIAVEKDVDGFNPENLGLLAQRTPRLRPCTPYGCMKMLEHRRHRSARAWMPWCSASRTSSAARLRSNC